MMARRERNRGWVWLVGLLLLAGCGLTNIDAEMKEAVQRTGAAMELQARAAQQTVAVGQPVRALSGEELVVEHVGGHLSGISLDSDQSLVVLVIVITNNSPGPLTMAQPLESYWMTDAEGRRYRPAAIQGLPTSELPVGATVRGTIAFAVKTASTWRRFTWQHQPLIAVSLPAS